MSTFSYLCLKSCCCCSVAQSCQSLCDPMDCSMPVSLSLIISQSLPKFKFIALVIPSNHLILWCPLLLLPSTFLRIRDFSNEVSVCIRWQKYWSFTFIISPSSDYSGLISLNTDWFDFLAVYSTFRSPPASQFEGIKRLKQLKLSQADGDPLHSGLTFSRVLWLFLGKQVYHLMKCMPSKFQMLKVLRQNNNIHFLKTRFSWGILCNEC